MKQPLYIRAATAISPQHTFQPDHFLKPVITSTNCKLFALEAPYADYISPVAIRRMSRIMKMTITTAMQCLKDAGITTPDAIITGTGRGGVTDMEVFVKDMIRLNEEALNPTAFIQSTYNSPNGWIAMQARCIAYNQTYVHRGCSFELALQDAQMLAAEATGQKNFLVGCYDELTEEYFLIRSKRGYWKKNPVKSSELLLNSSTSGTISGEGSAFFVLSNAQNSASASIEDVSIVYNATASSLSDAVNKVLKTNNILPEQLSLVLTGLNGDHSQSILYDSVLRRLPKSLPIAFFKHISGEYDTASGFGLWLANYLFSKQKIPNDMLSADTVNTTFGIDKILIINHFILGSASVMLLNGNRRIPLTSS